jgi:hypothetical protein
MGGFFVARRKWARNTWPVARSLLRRGFPGDLHGRQPSKLGSTGAPRPLPVARSLLRWGFVGDLRGRQPSKLGSTGVPRPLPVARSLLRWGFPGDLRGRQPSKLGSTDAPRPLPVARSLLRWGFPFDPSERQPRKLGRKKARQLAHLAPHRKPWPASRHHSITTRHRHQQGESAASGRRAGRTPSSPPTPSTSPLILIETCP